MRFMIRDLLWLTVVVALLLAWWYHSREKFLEREKLRVDLWSANLRAEMWKDRAEEFADSLRESGWRIEMDENSMAVGGPPVNKPQAPMPNP